jgi:hypothetical protein
MDGLNSRFGQTVVSVGPWAPARRWQCWVEDQLYAHSRGGGQLVSWLDAIQLRDLDTETRLELTCRTCGKVRFVTPAHLLTLGDFGHLWLSKSRPAPVASSAAAKARYALPCRSAGNEGFCWGYCLITPRDCKILRYAGVVTERMRTLFPGR